MSGIEYSDEQLEVIEAAVEMFNDDNEENNIFQFAGIPGSGKTTILKEIVRRCGLTNREVMCCAISGQAVSVLQAKGLNARTIHSLIYEVEEYESDRFNKQFDLYNISTKFILKGKFNLLDGVKLLFIDEGGMVDERIAGHLKKINIKKVVSGDLNQLPPISGKSGFLNDPNLMKLTRPFRTDDVSGIFRLYLDIVYNQPIRPNYNDVEIINIDSVLDIPNHKLLSSDVILTCTNKTKDYMNNKIRKLRGYTSELPEHGERVVFKRNNIRIKFGNISLVNGMSGIVVGESRMSGKNTFIINFKPHNINKTLEIECSLLYLNASREEKRIYKSSKKMPKGNFLEFGYADTVHSYQGSQAKNVMFIDETTPSHNLRKALQVTAITRAENSLIWARRKVGIYGRQ